MLVPTLYDKFQPPNGSYSVSDIQDYFMCILKKHGQNINNPSVRKYVNKIENRIFLKIKAGYSLEFKRLEARKLLGSTENKITKNKKQYQFIAILLIMFISKVQEFYIYLFQINHLTAYQKFLQKIISF